MTHSIERGAATQWDKSDRSFNNYQIYLGKKANRYGLTLIDLLYISNFKGGNATFNDPEEDVNNKLKSYSQKIDELNAEFKGLTLAKLKTEQIKRLTELITDTCNLVIEKSTKIDGFGVSYLSALLNAYFPNLIPILDRRVLINLNIVTRNDLDSQKQVKNIHRFYKELIIKVSEICRDNSITVREVDRQYFILKIDK